MNKFSLIITAGGTSSRYGNTNKLLEKINDKTVIEETVAKFIDFDEIDEIIISANISIIPILQEIFNNPKIKIIEGGNSGEISGIYESDKREHSQRAQMLCNFQ